MTPIWINGAYYLAYPNADEDNEWYVVYYFHGMTGNTVSVWRVPT